MGEATFARPAIIAVLIIGVISGFIPALQGVLLPQLVEEGRLGMAELGQVAMAEAMGTLIAVSLANAFLKPERLRLLVGAAALIGLLLDVMTARLSGGEILVVRFAHGLCAGVLLWLWVGLLTRIANPGRWVAIYVTAQASTLLVLSYLFATTVLPWGGAMAGFVVVAALYGLMGVLALFVPPYFAPLDQAGGSIMPDRVGWVALFAVFAHLAAILALWVYIKPYGQQIGLDDATIGLAISVALGSQILAGLLATGLAGRVHAGRMLVFVSLASIGALVLLGMAHTALPFIIGTTAFAFFWMLGPPFHMPFLIDVDPSRRSAIHMATAQLVGVAAGPAIASAMITDIDVSGALLAAAVFYAAGGAIIAALGRRPYGVAPAGS